MQIIVNQNVLILILFRYLIKNTSINFDNLAAAAAVA